MKTLKIGIIGCGGIANLHLNAYTQTEHCDVTWVYDVRESAAADLAHNAGARVAPSIAWMAENAGLDAVSVCTPPGTHLDACLPLLEAGIPVLCEKPLAATIEQAEQLAQAVERRRAMFMVAYCHRFHPPIVKLKELIGTGALGTPVFYLCTFSAKIDLTGNHRASQALSGGGCLMDNGAHAIDLLRHLFGEPTDIHALASNILQDMEVEDLAAAQIQVGKAVGQIINTYSAPSAVNRLEWTGSGGTAVVNYFQSDDAPDLVYRLEGQPGWTEVGCAGLPDRFVAQVQYFVDCVRTGKQPAPSAQDGLRTSQLIAQAYASAAHAVRSGAPSYASLAAM